MNTRQLLIGAMLTDGYEVGATYQMTFTPPTSGTATCTGGDDGGGFSDKNIRFTIK